MVGKDAHCSWCGAAFPVDAPWPRTCAQCQNASYASPLPVTVVLVPVDAGILAFRRAQEPARGQIALPTTPIISTETWQQTAARLLQSEAGLQLEASQIEDFCVRSSSDGTLTIVGLAPMMTRAALPPFQPTANANERLVVHTPSGLAFPIHDRILQRWFAQHDAYASDPGASPPPPVAESLQSAPPPYAPGAFQSASAAPAAQPSAPAAASSWPAGAAPHNAGAQPPGVQQTLVPNQLAELAGAHPARPTPSPSASATQPVEPAPARGTIPNPPPLEDDDDWTPDAVSQHRVTRIGRATTWGANDKGALGHGVVRPPGWEGARLVMAAGSEMELTEVAAGDGHTAFLTASGELYLSGSNQHYVHGGNAPRPRAEPEMVAALAGCHVSKIYACGTSQHLLAFVDGCLHAWGGNMPALGLAKKSPTLEPEAVTQIGSKTFDTGVREEVVIDVAVSSSHSIVLLRGGGVYMSGSNSRGQLGIGGPRNPYDTYELVEAEGTSELACVRAAAGTLHSALVTVEGRVFTCGADTDAQLGHGKGQDEYRLMPVTVGSVAGKRVVDVSAGATNTLCVCDDGTLHACGDNRLGQAGLGDIERAEQFTQVPLPSGLFARQVRCGEAHALVLCDDGTLLGFGRNQLGQVTPGKKDRYVKEPIVVELEGSVMSVAVGRAHNVVLVS